MVNNLSFQNSLNILVVEDNQFNQVYFKYLMQHWNHKITISKDGNTAIKMANREAYDLILMDIHLPILNGLEASKVIRTTNNPNKFTPIIGISASVIHEESKKDSSKLINDYLLKPFLPIDLARKITNLLKTQLIHKESTHNNTDNSYKYVDINFLYAVSNGDIQFILKLIDKLFEEQQFNNNNLKQLIHQQDNNKLRKFIHKLKASLSYFGLKEPIEELQKILLYMDSEQVKRVNSTLNLYFYLMKEALSELEIFREKLHQK